MRENYQKQMQLPEPTSDHQQDKELAVISDIIDSTPIISGIAKNARVPYQEP